MSAPTTISSIPDEIYDLSYDIITELRDFRQRMALPLIENLEYTDVMDLVLAHVPDVVYDMEETAIDIGQDPESEDLYVEGEKE